MWDHTNKQAADIFTKAFPDMPKWRSACTLINHLMPGEFPEVPELTLALPISLLPQEAVPSGSVPTSEDDGAGAHIELQKQDEQRPHAAVSLPDTCNRRLVEWRE